MTKKLERKIKAALKAENKELVLAAWNRYGEWVGTGRGEVMTKKQYLNRVGTTSYKVTMAAKADRWMYGWNPKKKYIRMKADGCPVSVGKFFSKELVDLEDEEFLKMVYEYDSMFGFRMNF